MTMMTRRRLLFISAAAVAASSLGAATRASTAHWQGAALGVHARITLRHMDCSEAAPLFQEIEGELLRLEGIFSLYRRDSALSRLNARGSLAAPPPELLEVLGLARAIHAETDGLFDPSVQPLFDCYARASLHSGPPDSDAVAEALGRVDFASVRFDTSGIALSRPGMALTLNGIAQGYVTDRIAALLRSRGLHDVLVDIGEIVAAGRGPSGSGWRVRIANGGPVLTIADCAIATSMPGGTVIDPEAQIGHILHPSKGWVEPLHGQVTVLADTAALADGYSTAAGLMSPARLHDLRRRAEVLLG